MFMLKCFVVGTTVDPCDPLSLSSSLMTLFVTTNAFVAFFSLHIFLNIFSPNFFFQLKIISIHSFDRWPLPMAVNLVHEVYLKKQNKFF